MKSVLHKKMFKFCFLLLSIVFYIIYIFIIDITPINIGYKYTYLLPFCFIFCFFFLLWDVVIEYRSPFLIAFCIVAFFRYVILPYALLKQGDYNGFAYVEPSYYNLQMASWLMMYELFAVSIAIRLYGRRLLTKAKNINSLVVQKNNTIYFIFFLVSFVAIIIIPQARLGVSIFLNINKSVNEEIGSNFLLLIRQCFVTSKYFIYFGILSYVYRRKTFKKSTTIYLLILLLTLIVMNIHIGTNRKSIISDAFALFFLLLKVFPQKKHTTIIILPLIALIMFSAFTIHRGFIGENEGVFSYFITLDVLQPYLLGEYNVALAIETKELLSSQIGIKNLLMDIFRPAFGIGSLLKDGSVLRSGELFALRLSYGGNYRQDQIIPIIGQGFIYCGVILAPVFSIIAAMLGIYCDTLYKKGSSMEATFFAAYFAINLAQAMSLSTTILINTITYRLGIVIPIFYLNLLINRSLKRKYGSSIIRTIN